jgi:hypothetical protein
MAASLRAYPAPTTTFAQSAFDTTFSPFGNSGIVTRSTDYAKSGTHSAKCVGPSSGSISRLSFLYSPTNPAAREANGLYERFWVLIEDDVLTDMQRTPNSPGQQIKLYLQRINGSQSEAQPGYFMAGIGPAFATNGKGQIQAARDWGIVGYGHPSRTLLAATWHEIQFWYRRGASATEYAFWFDGKLVMSGTDSSNLLGSPTVTDNYSAYFGVAFTGNLSIPAVVYVDDVTLANGFND